MKWTKYDEKTGVINMLDPLWRKQCTVYYVTVNIGKLLIPVAPVWRQTYWWYHNSSICLHYTALLWHKLFETQMWLFWFNIYTHSAFTHPYPHSTYATLRQHWNVLLFEGQVLFMSICISCTYCNDFIQFDNYLRFRHKDLLQEWLANKVLTRDG